MTGVAVVVLCFNQGRTIEGAVGSAQVQSHPPAELLVIDCESDDPYTQQALRRLERGGYRVVRGAGGGIASARNLGVRLTSAPYLVVLDADEMLDPEYLFRLATALDSNPDAGFATSESRTLGETDSSAPDFSWPRTMARGGPHPSSMFRRVLWMALGGFDQALAGYETTDFWVTALEKGHKGVILTNELTASHAEQERSLHAGATGRSTNQATIEALHRKHPPRTPDEGRALLLETEAFLAEQQDYGRSLARERDNLESCIAEMRQALRETKQRLGDAGLPAIDWGDLRRLQPISPVWGLDRGEPLDREYIHRFLDAHRGDITGRVLEIKDPGYTRRFGHGISETEILDLDASNPLATIVADLAEPDALPEGRVDCFILTQTVHIIYDIHSVLKNAYRVLKPGGVLLCTVPCLDRVSYEGGGLDEADFWRLTPAGLRAVFAEICPIDCFEVTAYGNVMTSAAFLHGLAPHEVPRQVLDTFDPLCPMVCGIRVVKPNAARAGHERPEHPPVGVPVSSAAGEDTGVVLLYHRIGRRQPDVFDLCVDTDDFRAQMRHVQTECHPLPLDELVSRVIAGTAPPRAVAVTFDDGYVENLEVVSPILSACGVPATFFVNTDALESTQERWWDVLERAVMTADARPEGLDLFGDGTWMRPTSTAAEREAAVRGLMELLYARSAKERSMIMERVLAWRGAPMAPRASHRVMRAAELVELAEKVGHTIGAHTVNHLALAYQTPDVQRQEMLECKALLERLLHREISSVAYPYGDYSGETVRAAHDCGFRVAVTVEGRATRAGSHRLMIPRYEIKRSGAAAFVATLGGLFASATAVS